MNLLKKIARAISGKKAASASESTPDKKEKDKKAAIRKTTTTKAKSTKPKQPAKDNSKTKMKEDIEIKSHNRAPSIEEVDEKATGNRKRKTTTANRGPKKRKPSVPASAKRNRRRV